MNSRLYDLFQTPLVFGCEQLGGYQWGNIDTSEILAAIDEAIDRGVRWFDTADVYGMGRSEEILGQQLKTRREEVRIITKFGVRKTNDGRIFYDCSPQWLSRALDESLKRLKTDYIDLYQVHYWDQLTPWQDIIEALTRERQRGRIRWLALSNGLPQDLNFLRHFDMYSTEFSLAAQNSRKFISEACRINSNLVIFPYGVLAQGMLTGKYSSAVDIASESDRRKSPKYKHFHGETLAENLKLLERMRKVQAQFPAGTPLSSIAIAWVILQFPLTVPIVGIKSRLQLHDALLALRLATHDAKTLDLLNVH